eukprot:UN25656
MNNFEKEAQRLLKLGFTVVSRKGFLVPNFSFAVIFFINVFYECNFFAAV